MSDFEDTGPEETEDQQCSKRDGGGGEEENHYSEDSGEEGDEQVRDNQQDQGGRLDDEAHKGDDGGGETCNENVEICQEKPSIVEESAGENVNAQNILEITAEKVGLVSLENNQKSQEAKVEGKICVDKI